MEIPNNLALQAGELIFFGGTAPIDKDKNLLADDVSGQTKAILKRIQTVLEKKGLGLANLCFVTIYLKDLADYQEMNQAYAEVLEKPYPARKVIEAPMTIPGMKVEMTAIVSAAKKEILA